MKRLKMKLITPMVLLVAMLSGQAYGQSTVPFEVNRLGLLTVGETDYYIPIPDGYSLEAADRRMGPDKSWLKASWLPEGRQMSNWSEMMSFLILPHNAPPIDVMAAQLSKSCPKSFFKERAAVPKCSGQGISDTTIGFLAAMFRSKTEGGRLPNTECRRSQL